MLPLTREVCPESVIPTPSSFSIRDRRAGAHGVQPEGPPFLYHAPALLTQAHLGNALDPLVSQVCILQTKQVQPFSLCVHLKGVLKAANTQTRIHSSSTTPPSPIN